MPHRYRVQTFKYLISAATALTALVMAAVMLCLSEWLGMVLLLLITLLFGWFTVLYGAVIVVTGEEVRKTFWGITLTRISWAAIREVGVIGTKIFKAKDTRLQGERYIYLSPNKMDENQRFQLAMKWPPKHIIYFSYTKSGIDQIQTIWSNVIDTYNAGDVFF